MEMYNVESSTIASIGYDYESAILRVQFIKSGIYDYYNVPSDLFEGLFTSGSKGTFLNIYIKNGGYSYSKI